MRRQKTPQKQDGKMSDSVDVPTAAVIVADVPSVTAVGSPATPSASAVVPAALPLDTVNSSGPAAALPVIDVTDASTKSKTPQTRKTRSRIAANFGALNSQS